MKTLIKSIEFKKLSQEAVKIVADYLILINGQTTTLEGKNELRKAGYWARQKKVSKLMASQFENFAENNLYRIYFS